MAAAAAAATAAGKTTKSTSEQALQLAAASVQQHQSSQASHSSVSSSTSALLATSKNRSPGQLASPLSTAVLHSQQLQSQNRQEEVQQQLISQHQPSMVVLPAAAAVKATSTVQPNTYSPSSNPVSAQIGSLPPTALSLCLSVCDLLMEDLCTSLLLRPPLPLRNIEISTPPALLKIPSGGSLGWALAESSPSLVAVAHRNKEIPGARNKESAI